MVCLAWFYFILLLLHRQPVSRHLLLSHSSSYVIFPHTTHDINVKTHHTHGHDPLSLRPQPSLHLEQISLKCTQLHQQENISVKFHAKRSRTDYSLPYGHFETSFFETSQHGMLSEMDAVPAAQLVSLISGIGNIGHNKLISNYQ